MFVLAVILVLSIASISALAVSPGDKFYAKGVWSYLPTGLNPEVVLPAEEYHGDRNKQIMSSAYISEWAETFVGDSDDYGLLVAHYGVPMVFIGTSSFDGVEVAGRVGDLEMDALGDRPTPTSDWRGSGSSPAGRVSWQISSGRESSGGRMASAGGRNRRMPG